MLKINAFILLLLCMRVYVSPAQPAQYKITPKEYIERYKDDAVRGMLLFHIPASITLAQGLLESGNGNSPLALYANNHFGIKCHNDWNGLTYTYTDDARNECFRKYPTVLDSYTDHTLFLKNRSRYSALFELKTTDYKGWARGLKKAGYATDPRYAHRLIDLIETHKLYQYDVITTAPTSPPQNQVIVTTASTNTKPIVTVTPPPAKVTNARKVLLNNERKYIIAQKGDTYSTLADTYEVELWEIYEYNELNKNAKLKPGDYIYLQPKRRKAKEEFHTVKKGETMYYISQQHGIKLKFLYRKNKMKPGTEPVAGEKLYLRSSKS